MFNRNNIFNIVDKTTNTIDINSGKKIDNIYSELNSYKDLYQTRYDKLTYAIETIKHYVNKINSLVKNNKDAMYGGSSNQSLMDQIDTCLESCEKLDSYEYTTIHDKTQKVLQLLNISEVPDDTQINLKKLENITAENITAEHYDYFKSENDNLNNIKNDLKDAKKDLDSLFKSIKDIQKPITDFIFKQSLSSNYIESIKKGIKEYENLKDTKYKKFEQQFNDYSFNIQKDLLKAQQAKKDSENPNIDVDTKILKVFLNNPKKIEIRLNESKNNGSLYISKNEKFDIRVDQRDDLQLIFIENTAINLQFILKGETNKLQPNTNYNNIKLSAETFIYLFKNNKYKDTPIIKYEVKLLNNFDNNRNIDNFNDIINKSNVYYLQNDAEINKIKNFFESLKSYDFQSDDFQSDDLQNIIPKFKNDNNSFFKVWYEWYTWNKKQKNESQKGGNIDKVKKDFKDTLTKIKSQLLDMVKKEYKTTNVKTEAQGDKNIKEYKTDKDTSQPINIITSIIENYEKERADINTITEKIKLDTKFIDMLDNLGLNLLDIFKVNFKDKFIFIFYTLILHIVVFSIIKDLIKNEYLTNIVYVIAVYVGIYFALLFSTILILNNFMSYRIRSLLNYLNTEFNMNLLTMHICIIFLFYLIVLILSNYVDVIKVEEDEDQLQLIFRIEIISSIIFIFSAFFIMLL